MVKKIIALGLLLAVSTAASAQVPPQSEANWQTDSLIKAATNPIKRRSEVNNADADVVKATPAQKKLEEAEEAKSSSYFARAKDTFVRAKDTFVNFVTNAVRGFCSLFGY